MIHFKGIILTLIHTLQECYNPYTKENKFWIQHRSYVKFSNSSSTTTCNSSITIVYVSVCD